MIEPMRPRRLRKCLIKYDAYLLSTALEKYGKFSVLEKKIREIVIPLRRSFTHDVKRKKKRKYLWNYSTKASISPLQFTLKRFVTSDNNVQNWMKSNIKSYLTFWNICDICWELCDVNIIRWRFYSKKYIGEIFLE